jgi:ubiquinone/menaquinone biosynthesis C-methylase UbiE
MNDLLLKLYAWGEPVVRLIDPSTKTILDVACGPSWPMKLLRQKFKFDKVVGVDLYEPYIAKAREEGVHDEYVIRDVRDLPFEDKSFDTVLALQIIEHLEKEEAWKMIDNLERIAKKQVIIATPIGEMYHPDEDGNELQLHHSHFYPEDLEAKGYKTIKYGRKSILGENGIVHKIKFRPLRQLIFLLNLAITPLYFKFQPLSDYHVYAIKNLNK